MQEERKYPIRILVETNGIWRADQVARTLLAIDAISARVSAATYIGEICEAYDWAIRSYGFLGFIGGKPKSWKKPKSPSDLELRNALMQFVSQMRNLGLEVDFSPLGAKYTVLVDDLYEIVPSSWRAEIEYIKMASPGEWSLLLANTMKSENAIRLLDKIFDSLFFWTATKKKKAAEAEESIAKADLIKAIARKANAEADFTEVKVRREEMNLLLDYSVALDSIDATLLNAGIESQQTLKIRKQFEENIRTLALQKSLGQLKKVSTHPVKDTHFSKSKKLT